MSRAKRFISFLETDTGDLIGKVLTQDQDRMQSKHELLKAEAKRRPALKPEDVKTVHDVDVYRYQKACLHGEKFIPSHYDTLKELYGEKKADIIMRNQEVGSWKFGK